MNLNPIRKLLAEYASTEAEIVQIKALIVELGKEDAILVKTIDLNDEAQYQALANVRLKKEIAQGKLPQYAERLEGLRKELDQEARAGIRDLNVEVDAAVAATLQKLTDAMRPFFHEDLRLTGAVTYAVSQVSGPISDMAAFKTKLIMGDPFAVAKMFFDKAERFSKLTAGKPA